MNTIILFMFTLVGVCLFAISDASGSLRLRKRASLLRRHFETYAGDEDMARNNEGVSIRKRRNLEDPASSYIIRGQFSGNLIIKGKPSIGIEGPVLINVEGTAKEMQKLIADVARAPQRTVAGIMNVETGMIVQNFNPLDSSVQLPIQLNLMGELNKDDDFTEPVVVRGQFNGNFRITRTSLQSTIKRGKAVGITGKITGTLYGETTKKVPLLTEINCLRLDHLQ